jgi:hypothetical protein
MEEERMANSQPQTYRMLLSQSDILHVGVGTLRLGHDVGRLV